MKNLSDKGKMHSTQTVDCCVGLDYWNTIQVSGKNASSATTNNRFFHDVKVDKSIQVNNLNNESAWDNFM